MSALGQYTSFDFDKDAQFQQGIEAILSEHGDPKVDVESINDMVRRAKVFYFNHVTGNNITVEDICAFERDQSSATESNGERILSFTELQQLIEAGRLDEIPNNKHIPDGLSADKPSASRLAPQRKPWEAA